MTDTQIPSINQLAMSDATREKIIKQANFAGLDQNLADGDLVTLKVGNEICYHVFNRQEALLQHTAPGCSTKDEMIEDTSFSTAAELATLLNLPAPVSQAVFLKAKEDDSYFHNLLVSRTAPDFLTYYLKEAEEGLEEAETDVPEGKTSNELIIDFGRAMLKWGTSGFAKVNKETYQQRINSCFGCDRFKSVPDKLIYKVLSKKGKSGICGSCGCLVEKKALLATDTCPEASLHNPGLNRWGEFMKT